MKRLLIFVGILLVIITGAAIYLKYSGNLGTVTQNPASEQGEKDPATGSFITGDGQKHIEYQGKRYLLDGDYCVRSLLKRFPVTVKRFNGAQPAKGKDGNTMYTLRTKDDPEYIDASDEIDEEEVIGRPVRDCWQREPQETPEPNQVPQNYEVIVKVVDVFDLKPVANVLVEIVEGFDISGTIIAEGETDAGGKVTFKIPRGTYNIGARGQASGVGRRTIEVTDNLKLDLQVSQVPN